MYSNVTTFTRINIFKCTYVHLCLFPFETNGTNAFQSTLVCWPIMQQKSSVGNLVGNDVGNPVGNSAGNLAGNLVGDSAGNLMRNSVGNLDGMLWEIS